MVASLVVLLLGWWIIPFQALGSFSWAGKSVWFLFCFCGGFFTGHWAGRRLIVTAQTAKNSHPS